MRLNITTGSEHGSACRGLLYSANRPKTHYRPLTKINRLVSGFTDLGGAASRKTALRPNCHAGDISHPFAASIILAYSLGNQQDFLLQAGIVTVNQFNHATDCGQIRPSKLGKHCLAFSFLKQCSV
jgi:hypothetical protein